MTAFNRAVEDLKQVEGLAMKSPRQRAEIVRNVWSNTEPGDLSIWRIWGEAALAGTINTETGEITDREYPTGEEG